MNQEHVAVHGTERKYKASGGWEKKETECRTMPLNTGTVEMSRELQESISLTSALAMSGGWPVHHSQISNAKKENKSGLLIINWNQQVTYYKVLILLNK